ncbi:Mitochondrial protein [Smittium mucronatum]|uniref:Mitochondrial protein n=1 Tax=Smittium mucronatum TaxID=133383 RepID=A0A1R0H858_9FUNG|nr:Mitochondrial protein [Smittium mucronatum]
MPTCEGVRKQFINCLLESDCVLIQRNSVSDCIRNRELKATLPEKCLLLSQSLFDCKRGLLDMRRRTKGVPNAGNYD